MEGFTVALALVDAIPVLLFGGSMILVASKFGHTLFIVGAVISTLAGCCKVAWKLILGIWKKDLRWLNKPFVPMQATGFLLMLISFGLGFRRISWGDTLGGILSIPAVLFFAGWLGLMGFMGWYRKNKFRNEIPPPTGRPSSSTAQVRPACCWAFCWQAEKHEKTPGPFVRAFAVFRIPREPGRPEEP